MRAAAVREGLALYGGHWFWILGILQVIHGVSDTSGDAVVVAVHLDFLGQVAGFGDQRQDGLPGLLLVAVLILFIIGIGKDALTFEIVHIPADIVIAEVQIVAAVRGVYHGVVADGGENAAHGGVLFAGKGPLHRLVQVVGVLEEQIDLLHQHARTVEHEVHDGRHAYDHEDAANAAPKDLTERLLHLAGGVKGLFDDGKDDEAEGHDDADQRHAPIDIGDGLVGKEDVDEVLRGVVVLDADQTGENLKHIVEDADDPAEDAFEIVEKPEDGGIEDTFQDGGKRAAHPVRYGVPEIAEHWTFPPFLTDF